jgi:hypothetical protein
LRQSSVLPGNIEEVTQAHLALVELPACLALSLSLLTFEALSNRVEATPQLSELLVHRFS